VIQLGVDDEALVTRISGRSTCGNCGEVYHDVTKPQPADGKCEKCGASDFKRRADDNEESLRNRLMEYYKKTSPLLGFYYAKDMLKRVDGLAPMAEVKASIAAILD
jgi:adenylate kinase